MVKVPAAIDLRPEYVVELVRVLVHKEPIIKYTRCMQHATNRRTLGSDLGKHRPNRSLVGHIAPHHGDPISAVAAHIIPHSLGLRGHTAAPGQEHNMASVIDQQVTGSHKAKSSEPARDDVGSSFIVFALRQRLKRRLALDQSPNVDTVATDRHFLLPDLRKHIVCRNKL